MENRITISICDEEYTFVAEEAPSYMQKVGSYVNDKMSELLDAAKVGRTDAAVLTAVNITDELFKEREAGSRKSKPLTTELLAPAGGQEALVAAVQSGADAVYMGFGAFNARRSARNFSDEEFRAAVSYCHLRGVKVYLTLNTLVTDRELSALAAEARTASECGVDAILVQDWGVLATLQKIIPGARARAFARGDRRNLPKKPH